MVTLLPSFASGLTNARGLICVMVACIIGLTIQESGEGGCPESRKGMQKTVSQFPRIPLQVVVSMRVVVSISAADRLIEADKRGCLVMLVGEACQLCTQEAAAGCEDFEVCGGLPEVHEFFGILH